MPFNRTPRAFFIRGMPCGSLFKQNTRAFCLGEIIAFFYATNLNKVPFHFVLYVID